MDHHVYLVNGVGDPNEKHGRMASSPGLASM